MRTGLKLFAIGFGMLLAVPNNAAAYTIKTPVTPGCHEQLTVGALRAVRGDPATGAAATPPVLSREDRAVVDDLPFPLPTDAQDIAAAALVAGVRDNDLRGEDPVDVFELSAIHNDEDGQDGHSLRRIQHDEPDGSARALADTFAFIERELAVAVDDGVSRETGVPDNLRRSPVTVHLAFRGQVRPPLPTFYFHMGRALHTLQDTFSHTLRSPDGLRVRVVLNWLEANAHQLDPVRDGPAHMQALDACRDLDGLRSRRLALAQKASTEVLSAALNPALPPAERKVALHRILTSYLTLEAGCTADNQWCQAPELRYMDKAPWSCSVSHGSPKPTRSRGGLLILLIVPFILVSRGRRGRPRALGKGSNHLTLCAVLAAALTLASRRARAQEADSARAFHVNGRAGASLDRTATFLAAGIRHRTFERWSLGASLEWNPWISLDRETIRPGSLNVYASLIRHYSTPSKIDLSTTASVGTSTLLFDLYGTPVGSTGPFVALSWLGLEIDLGKGLRLLIDPVEIAVPIPSPRAFPSSTGNTDL